MDFTLCKKCGEHAHLGDCETEKREFPVDNIVSASGTPKAQYALDRMKRAYDKGRGIRLSWEELDDIAFDKVIKQATKKLEYLENAPPYAHEERG